MGNIVKHYIFLLSDQIKSLQAVNSEFLELIFSLISFVLITTLYSTLIVPQLTKLKNLRDKLYKKIKIPKDLIREPGSGRSMGDDKRLRDKVILPINQIFDEYEIKSKHLKEFMRLFWITVILILTLLFIIWLNLWILPVFLIFIFIILLVALEKYAPSSNKIRDIGWLINTAFINPHTIWETMQLTFTYSDRQSIFYRPKLKEDLIFFSLSPGVFYTGYRFFFQITDEKNKKVYFCSFGLVKNSKNILKTLFPDGKVYYSINIGSIPLGLIRNKNLKATIFILAPAFPSEKTNPFVIKHNLNKLKKDELPRSYSTMTYMDTDLRDRGITLYGSGSKLSKLTTDHSQDKSSVNFELFDLIKSYLKTTNNIQFYYNTKGKLIETKLHQLILKIRCELKTTRFT